MKKFKNTFLFIIVLLIIFAVDFLIYKNIDILIPKQEKKLFSYTNDRENKDKYFLYELSKQIEQKNDYKKISNEELKNILDNKILNNLIINYIYEMEFDDFKNYEKIKDNIYVASLTNTIYGDLKVISIRNKYYKGPNNLIVYSEDMQKLYYYDLTKDVQFKRNTRTIWIK